MSAGRAGRPAGRLAGVEIREYRPEDELSWLQCRALSFLDTCYYDDVWPTRRHEDDAVELVAVDPSGEVAAILDLSFAADNGVLRATIDTVAVRPEHRRPGLADALLQRGLVAVRHRGAVSLDAWTREDAAGAFLHADSKHGLPARPVPPGLRLPAAAAGSALTRRTSCSSRLPTRR